MRQSVSQDRDGFHQTKRAVTICDLFVNQAYTISDIVRVFNEDRRNVVLALLDQGIVRERRTKEMASRGEHS
jgi:hypothetical protein